MSAPLFVLLLALSLHAGLSTESLKAEDGYEVFPAYPWSRYKVPSVKLNWSDALAYCQGDGEGATLVVFNSDEEAKVVKELINTLVYKLVWVGINDLELPGQWRTVQGGLVSESGYNSWYPGYPAVSTTWNCGYVGTFGLYINDPCSTVWSFICEKPNA